VKRCGSGYSQVYWSNSGAEAIEAALKFAVLATSKKRFIVCEHGYHGKTLGALSATAGEKYKQPFAPLLWDFVTIPFNDTQALEQALDDQTAAFIVEPIQGEGGIFTPASDYLKRAKELCTAHGTLLVIDEIQTGVGRTGHFLASQGAEVSADILCLGKGLAGGIPVGATVVTEYVAKTITKHIHTSTFGGNPLACAGVIATLNLLTDVQLQDVQRLGTTFKQALTGLRSDLIE
jgi:acetylornithine/succinyldiaminopimelate/putrescine aminotransferase